MPVGYLEDVYCLSYIIEYSHVVLVHWRTIFQLNILHNMQWKDVGYMLIGKGTDGNDSDLFYGIIPPLACLD